VSAATFALRQILPALEDNVFDYSDPKDFEKLWSFSGLPEDRILIVWGRTAGDDEIWPIDASSYLSPIDWAIAYVSQLQDNPWPRVLILDATPNSHLTTSSLATYRYFCESHLAWLSVPVDPDLNAIDKWIGTSEGGFVPCDESRRSHAQFLNQIRAGLRDHSGDRKIDRHSVFNLLAPLILNSGRSVPTRDKAGVRANHPRALLKLLCPEQVARLADVDPSFREALPQLDEASQSGLEGGVRFVLLDDQAKHGWAEWVEFSVDRLLPGSTCQAWVEPTSLIQRLEETLQARCEARGDCRFDLRLGADDRPEVLLLDLRLFAGQSGDREERFFQRLLRLCREYEACEDADAPNPFAWPGFSAEELDRVEEWCQLDAHERADRERGAFPEASGLLARLVALIDPTLPVIIFSSSSRADLFRQFDQYGSIITDFSKPHDFLVPSGEVIRDSHMLLMRAVRRALPMVKLRSWVTQTAQRVGEISERRKALQVFEKSVVEIYIDESGTSLDPPFTVGGVLVIYPNADSIKALAEGLKSRNLVWGLDETFEFRRSRTLDKIPRHGERLESDPYGQPIGDLQALFNDLRIQVAGVALNLRGRPDMMLPQGLKGFDESLTDLRYFKMLTDLLEYAIFGLVRGITTETKIGINVATKTGTIRLSREDEAKARYGLRFAYKKESELNFYSVSSESVLPTVASALGHHLRSDLQFDLLRLKTCALADFDSLERDKRLNPKLYSDRLEERVGALPRQIHYLADWMARFGNRDKYDEIPEIARDWFSAGFLQRQGQASAATVLALRAADTHNWREGIRLMKRAENFEYNEKSGHSRWPAIDFLLPRLREWCGHLDGRNLWALASEMETEFKGRTGRSR
jgi:hypothetical protein